MKSKRFGIIGGLGPLASADIFYKLVRHTPAGTDKDHFDIVFEQHPFSEEPAHGSAKGYNPTARKLYVFNLIKQFEDRHMDAVILPCFISHTFIDELKSEIKLPIVNMMTALHKSIQQQYPNIRRLGVLTSNYVRDKKLFEQYFDFKEYELIYPCPDAQERLDEAIYGPKGIKAGQTLEDSIEVLASVCQDLTSQGAKLVLPGFTEIPTVVDALQEKQLPIVDSNRIYAEYAIRHNNSDIRQSHRIGVVGGIGPAATVDFMNKIIRHTDAKRDQDHIKLVVHHNPQIPDRTEHLIGDGSDPTIQLFAACRHLEADEVDFITIPCNTAHAFVDRLQRYLSIPIVNMLEETVNYVGTYHQDIRKIGLLATSGTIESRVYHDAFTDSGFQLIAPDEVHQNQVMEAIYGVFGVKSGHTSGQCQEDIQAVIDHVLRRGAEAVILGCTELPLLVNESFIERNRNNNLVFLDPTDILAQRCVHLVKRVL